MEINDLIIKKRNGSKVVFDRTKIEHAIQKSCMDVKDFNLSNNINGNLELSIKITDKVIDDILHANASEISIEKIQDLVEHKLMCSNRKDVAASYIGYRRIRAEERNKIENLDKRIYEIVDMQGDKVHENANKDANVWATKRDLVAGTVAKDYAWRHILPKDITEAHDKGEIHWHDADYSPMFSMFNCMLIDFPDMLKNGFCIGNADIESPKGINTATALVAQIVANVSSNIYGGTTFNRVDEVLAPYAELTANKHRKIAEKYVPKEMQDKYVEEQTRKSIYDAMQSLEYELNTLYNSNGQTPFFTLGFGLGTSCYAREIQKAILQVRIDGLGASHKTPVFPKLIFSLKDGVNFKPSDPNYDVKQLALKCAVKRIYPDIVNYDRVVELTGGFKFCMGCRSFLGEYKDENGTSLYDGRMNLGVVSLNLPHIALETNSMDEYIKVLDQRLELVGKALKFRIHTLDKVQAKNAPILYMYGATGFRLKADDYVADIFKNGYASVSIGYIGLHEVAVKFFGEHWQHNKEAKAFTVNVLKRIYEKAETLKKETGYGFSVYATPSEGLCDRFCKCDVKQFGEVPGITDKGYYTNSFHYDVQEQVTPFEKITFEKEYLPYTSGGYICFCEFPSLRKNTKALETYWDFCYGQVPYIGANSPIDKCFLCGYEGEFLATNDGFVCPQCGNHDPATTNCIRRICGYLGDPEQRPVNKGKLKEMQRRKKSC